MEQESWDITSFGQHVAREELGAALQELGWQGLWYLAHGCGPPVRSRAMLGITFPSKLQSSQEKKGFFSANSFILGMEQYECRRLRVSSLI